MAVASVAAIALPGVWLMDRALRIGYPRTRRHRHANGRRPTAQPTPGASEEARETVGAGGGGSVVVRGGGAVRQRVLLALALVVVCSALVTAWLVRRIVRPVGALRDATERLAHRRSHGRFGDGGRADAGADGGDELAPRGSAFNHMAVASTRSTRQRRDLTNDVAHELRTPLTNLRCHLEALAEGLAPFTAEGAQALLADAGHLQRIVDDLADLARADSGQLAMSIGPVDLGPVLGGLAREMRPRFDTAGVTLEIDDLASFPTLLADRRACPKCCATCSTMPSPTRRRAEPFA